MEKGRWMRNLTLGCRRPPSGGSRKRRREWRQRLEAAGKEASGVSLLIYTRRW
jgi:hypothetical protein